MGGCSSNGSVACPHSETQAVSIEDLDQRLSQGEDTNTENAKAAQKDISQEDIAVENWRPGCGRALNYGAFTITSDQAEAIHELRVALSHKQTVKGNNKIDIHWQGDQEVLSPRLAVSGNLVFLKFLIAHGNDIQKAVQYVVRMQHDRRELGLETVHGNLLANWNDEFNLLDFSKIEGGVLLDTWESFQNNCPFSDALGVTKTNMEIKVFRPGFWDLKKLMKEVDVEKLRRVNMYKHEHFLIYGDRYAFESGAILRRCTLEDFTGFSFGPYQQWNMKSFRFVIFSELDPNYWPEEVGRLHAVYAPWLIGALLKFIKALNVVTPRTWDSIRIFTTPQHEAAKEELLHYVDMHQLPAPFGGTKPNEEVLFRGEPTIF
jgi:hypothetical protein